MKIFVQQTYEKPQTLPRIALIESLLFGLQDKLQPQLLIGLESLFSGPIGQRKLRLWHIL
jgi:hypothetical protein